MGDLPVQRGPVDQPFRVERDQRHRRSHARDIYIYIYTKEDTNKRRRERRSMRGGVGGGGEQEKRQDK